MKIKLLALTAENLKSCQVEVGARLLLAVSGGVDSIVLTHLIAELAKTNHYDYALVHLDHSLRGQASLKDYRLVEQLAKSLGCEFYGFKYDVPALAKQEKVSFELAARKLRHQLFAKVMSEHKYDYLLTAHHLGDNAETILLNLFRGTGLKGLSGIALQNGKIIRPLINVSKEKLYALANAEHWHYHEDVTNRELTYARNRIRRCIIPEIERHYNPRLQEQLAQTAEIIASEDAFLEKMAEQNLERLLKSGGNYCLLNIEKWQTIDIVLRRRMIRALYHRLRGSTYHLGFEHINMLDEWFVNGKIASKQHLFGLDFVLNQKQVSISLEHGEQERQEQMLALGEHYIIEYQLLFTVSDKVLDDTDIYLPKEQFSLGLSLRFPQPNDYMRALGMKGHRKSLKKIISETKINIAERKNIPLLAIRDEVIWVKGLRKSVYSKKNITRDDIIYISIKDMSREERTQV